MSRSICIVSSIFILFLSLKGIGQTTKTPVIIRGVYLDVGMIVDSATKKAQPNFKISCVSGLDSVILTSNSRGKLSMGDSLGEVPDSISIVSATPGYHVTYYKIKVREHGTLPDASGNENTFYWVEVSVRVARD